jgi:flagellum-specific peptidoglycan hydrolase FlgJ
MTALVSLGAGGAVTGFSFVPGTVADLTSPAGMPIRLMALQQAARPATADDTTLRSAIVNVANYYLRMAQRQTPAEMEALIWQHDSIDGVDHGESCAAFASLTLELAAQVVGQQSWVTGGTSYPWPLHKWADGRVDPNPASLGITSVLQDAQDHQRWHPLGDGYQPLPGDWVLFNGHVEVVTKYAGGILHTVGGDSLPNLSVNAHAFPDPLGEQGVVGFVNNGNLPAATTKAPRGQNHASAGHQPKDNADPGLADIPGAAADRPAPASQVRRHRTLRQLQTAPGPQPQPSAAPAHAGTPAAPDHPVRPVAPAGPGAGLTVNASVPGAAIPERAPRAARKGTAAIPGLSVTAYHLSVRPAARPADRYRRHRAQTAQPPQLGTAARQVFISEVAPGAVAAQRRYGVPASVTIAQAIDESGWGRSSLAAKDHNLFGIKGTGPAGSDSLPTQEYEHGQSVTRVAAFRAYHNFAESIDDHGRLLATSGYYGRSMAYGQDPNAFAAALTGVYATDPDYGAKLISLMRQYDLYRYDVAAPASPPPATGPGVAAPEAAAPDVGTTPAPRAQASRTAPPAPRATAPEVAAPGTTAPQPSAPAAAPAAAGPESAAIPGLPDPAPPPLDRPASASRRRPAPGAAGATAGQSGADRPRQASPSTQTASAVPWRSTSRRTARQGVPHRARAATSRYQQQIPLSVKDAFRAMARTPLTRAEPLYRDVASHRGIRWELLAACDWMQCQARPRFSPVHGEKLGTLNPDGTIYRTKSAALEQCADELAELASAVYRIDLTAPDDLSIRDLANVFAAFRWGGLLKQHRTSAMEFPYSVAGLTGQHLNMRWPNINEPHTPDKPGSRFRMPFGAVPVVLGLDYPATV